MGRRDDRRHLRGLVERHGEAHFARERRAPLAGGHRAVGMGQHDPQRRRHRQLDHLERLHRAHQHQAAQQAWGDVVGMAAGHARLRFESGEQHRPRVHRAVEQQARRERAGHRGGGAPPLPTRERQPFRQPELDAEPGVGAAKDLGRRDPAGVTGRVARQRGVPGIGDDHAGLPGAGRLNRVARPGHREPQDVEPGADVADGAGCVDADLCGHGRIVYFCPSSG